MYGKHCITDWLQQQVWGDIDQLQMLTQHGPHENTPEIRNKRQISNFVINSRFFVIITHRLLIY